MGLFRSEEMEFYNLIIPIESAWDVMNALGQYDTIHFVDYDPSLPQLNRPFLSYIKRCDDALQKIDKIREEMKNFKIKISHCENVKELLLSRVCNHKIIDELESQVQKDADDLDAQQKILRDLQEKKNTLIENIEVMKKSINIQNDDQDVKFQQIVGVIAKEDELRFKRIVFRITKGNVYVELADIEQALVLPNHETVRKCVFVILFPNGDVTHQKLKKVIESFQASKFEPLPNQEAFEQKMDQLHKQMDETENLISMTMQQIDILLKRFAQNNNGCSYIEDLRIFLEKEKYLYQNLNLLKMNGSVFQGQLWLPKSQDQVIQTALRNLNPADRNLPSGQLQSSKTNDKPPTYFKLNEFTTGFQEIVNTYGIPRYLEINPGLSTIITFPFLFGVMFGDIGHGFLLLACSIYLCTQDAKDSIFKALIPIRYMLMLMGFFAFYNGFIYNDYLSFGLNLFGSCYQLTDGEFVRQEDCNYTFGIDPVWAVSGNHLAFMNSYKMKLAVIIGVIHMVFGIVLKGLNSIHFDNYTDFFFEFIPQLLLMICSFGYMDFLLILKWSTHFEDTQDAPSVITTMIDMVLTPFALPEKPLFADAELQRSIQLVLLLVIVLCVPTMLFFKPYIINASNKISLDKTAEVEINEQVQQYDENDESAPFIQQGEQGISDVIQKPQKESHENEEFGDLFVHQVIETIEFVLGSVSNTASYLRLWALSLAHSQLAEVFYDMHLGENVKNGGFFDFFGLIFKYPNFALATFGVLMCMDLMECFLHALRLQWVEFQNKFYKADGYLFNAYSFNKVLSKSDEDEDDI